jgi:hypothetical protein
MKAWMMIAVLSVLSVSAEAAVVSSKQGGKAFCAKNLADRAASLVAPVSAKVQGLLRAGSGR